MEVRGLITAILIFAVSCGSMVQADGRVRDGQSMDRAKSAYRSLLEIKNTCKSGAAFVLVGPSACGATALVKLNKRKYGLKDMLEPAVYKDIKTRAGVAAGTSVIPIFSNIQSGELGKVVNRIMDEIKKKYKGSDK